MKVIVSHLIFAASILSQSLLAEQRLRVGVITPLSGTLVASGEAVRNAVILADSLYDDTDLVTFSFEDNGFQPKNSVTIARKFISQGVDAVIIFGTPTSMAVVPLTEQAEITLAAITIVDKVVKDAKYAVRHFVSWQEENRRIVEEVRRRGYKRVAIIATLNDASLALRDGFISGAAVEVVVNQEFSPDNMDFQAVAAKIKSAKPDAVYMLLFAPQGSAFMKVLRALDFRGPVFAAHNVEDPSEISAAQGAFDGIWFVTGDDRSGEPHRKAYQEKFGAYPAMGWGNAFDYAKMIIEAAEKNVPLIDYIKRLKDFEGVFGRYGAAEGNSFTIKAVTKLIDGVEMKVEE
ncbi:MAG: hypothetical protein DCC75_01460 [Proteobacteria bacterium]|nr:MAG: hypothetical protein DCC75_01460 [Pseudomonadota bacterium]